MTKITMITGYRFNNLSIGSDLKIVYHDLQSVVADGGNEYEVRVDKGKK